MAENTVKEMTTNFKKLDKFEGHDFRRWQKKMHFLLTTLKVVYVLTTPMPELLEDATVEAIRIRAKWENDDYICRGHILNGMSDSLFDVYTNVESAKELWDSLESKYMAEDSSSKKFLVSNFNNYKMVDSRPVMEQYNELLRILGQYTQHGLKMDESISVSSIIDKLPPSWKDFKHTLKHGKDDLSLVQLGSHLRLEESLRAQDSDKGKGKKVVGPSVTMAEEGKNKNNKQNKGKKRDFKEHGSGSGSNKKPKLECWKCGKTGHFKRDCRNGNKNANAGGSGKGSKDHSQDQGQNLVPVWIRFIKYFVSLISEAFYVQVDAIAWWINSGATTHVCKDRCWFKTYEPGEDRSVLYMGDDHFPPVYGKGSVNLISGPVLDNCGYKQVYESDKYILSKCGVFVGFGYYNNGMFMLNLNKVLDDSDSVYMSSSSTVVNSLLWHARLRHVHYKRMLEMSKDELIPAIDKNPDKCTTCMLTKITRKQFKSITMKSVILELIHSDLCDFHATPSLGIIHETTAPYTPQQNGVAKRKNKALKEIIPYQRILYQIRMNLKWDDHSDDVPSEIPKPRKGKRVQKAKSYGYDFQLYLVERSRDQVGSQYSYCYSIEEDPRTYNEAMQYRDSAFWKEAIDDEIGSIMKNNTWVLFDLPPG
ncbi:zinc finger, CCHC-type containing protein [Tanacetum coccineum]